MKVCRGGIMVKTGRRTGCVRRARIPAWINDIANQNRWNEQFIEILKSRYSKSDATIAAILTDRRRSQECATKIRTYLDEETSAWLYEQRKARGAKFRKQLQLAVAGLRAAIDLCMDQGKQEIRLTLEKLVAEFLEQLGRCNQAFATKRHGRDRDHAILLECHSFLECELRQSVTYVTLANLVNAGNEAEGNLSEEPVDEEQIRKNLANFKRNNPLWQVYSSIRSTRP